MDASQNGHVKQANRIIGWVWYSGTDAILEGEAVCQDVNYGTVTDVDGRRHNHVSRPNASNNLAFAGVAARDYSAKATGQFIEINMPGSRGVNVAIGSNVATVGELLTFHTGRGRFVTGNQPGCGSVRTRQTNATGIATSDLTTGAAWSLATDGVTLTMGSNTLGVGDKVVIVAGESKGTVAVPTYGIVPGTYTIASATSATVKVLTKVASYGTQVAVLFATGYAFANNPKVQADLLAGDESGGIEFITAPLGGGAITFMVGGTTKILGTLTMAANATVAYAAGATRKDIICLGAITTSDYVVTVAGGYVGLDGATARTTIAFDAVAEVSSLVFYADKYCAVHRVGSTEG